MTKEIFRTLVGVSVIVVHAVCFIIIFFGKDDYLSPSQQIDVGLLFMPITATYVVAVVRATVENASTPVAATGPVAKFSRSRPVRACRPTLLPPSRR
jgi:hypothetical protein